jgi:hypothetical protein
MKILIAYSKELRPSWKKPYSCLTVQVFSVFHGIQIFITVFTTTYHLINIRKCNSVFYYSIISTLHHFIFLSRHVSASRAIIK